MRKILLGYVLFIFIVGCSTLNKVAESDIATAVQIGVDYVILEEEYETALELLLFNNFNDLEQRKIEIHILALQRVKDGLDAAAKGDVSGAAVLLRAAQAKTFLEDIAVHYEAIQDTYIGYITRENIRPDPDLVAYSQVGIRIWRGLYGLAQTGEEIDVSAVQGLLTTVVRGYVFYNSGVVI